MSERHFWENLYDDFDAGPLYLDEDGRHRTSHTQFAQRSYANRQGQLVPRRASPYAQREALRPWTEHRRSSQDMEDRRQMQVVPASPVQVARPGMQSGDSIMVTLSVFLCATLLTPGEM